MKNILLYSFVSFVFLYSCTNDKYYQELEKLDNFLVIGDNSASIKNVDSLIIPPDRCKKTFYDIDLDADGINDFRYFAEYCYSPSHFYSYFEIKCLHSKAKVSVNDTVFIPQMLNVGDRLNHSMNWVSDSIVFMSSSGTSPIIGGTGIISPSSYWVNSNNKYMGLLLEKDETPMFAWVKISVPNGNRITSFTIHEIGYKKASY